MRCKKIENVMEHSLERNKIRFPAALPALAQLVDLAACAAEQARGAVTAGVGGRLDEAPQRVVLRHPSSHGRVAASARLFQSVNAVPTICQLLQ